MKSTSLCIFVVFVGLTVAGCEDDSGDADLGLDASEVDAALGPDAAHVDANSDSETPDAAPTVDSGPTRTDTGPDSCSPACVHGTCQDGACMCDSGYSGEACDVGDGTTHYIVRDNEPRADIVVADDAPKMVTLAADLFQGYIEDMAGAVLPLGHSPNTTYDFHVYIGSSQYTDDLGVSADGTEYGGFKIVADDHSLVLLGDDSAFRDDLILGDDDWDALTAPDKWLNTYPGIRTHNRHYDIWEQDKRGSMNAVHAFLRDQGMRWYYPNSFGTVTPSKQDIAFPSLNRLVNPDFGMRDIYLYYKHFDHLRAGHYPADYPYGSRDENLDWIVSLGINHKQEFFTNLFPHGINAVTGRQETQEQHPEYYAIWDGTRMDGLDGRDMKQNLCSQALLDATIRYAKFMFDTYDAEYVDIWPADGYTQISETSPECEALKDPARGRDGYLSDYVWDFVNKVAWAIHDDPDYDADKKIVGGAYSTYQLPPQNLSDSRGLAPNISVAFAQWRTGTMDDTGRTHYRQLINQWLDILPSGEIFRYDYYLQNRRDRVLEATPIFYPHAIADDLRFLKGKSKGEFIEVNTNWSAWDLDYDTFAAQALNVYVTTRLYWDVDQDVDALLDEYYHLYYGPAGDRMKALGEYSENNYDMRLNPEYVDTMRTMAEEALDIVGEGTAYAERIANLLEFMNSNYAGDNVSVDSCQVLDSPGTTYTLTADVSSSDTCFPVDANGVTIDCAGHTIDYGSAGGEDAHGIRINARRTDRGHYFDIKDCSIQDTTGGAGAAIYVKNADHGAIEQTTIEAGTGISVYGAQQIEYRANTVNTDGTAMRAQYGGHDGPNGYVSSSTYEDNVFSSSSGNGAYLYRIDGDQITNNEFSSASTNGLNLYKPVDTLLKNNTISSDSTDAIRVIDPSDLQRVDNTLDGN